jgi:hypothetical protein
MKQDMLGFVKIEKDESKTIPNQNLRQNRQIIYTEPDPSQPPPSFSVNICQIQGKFLVSKQIFDISDKFEPG